MSIPGIMGQNLSVKCSYVPSGTFNQSWQLLVDGVVVGSGSGGNTITIPVTSGNHTVAARCTLGNYIATSTEQVVVAATGTTPVTLKWNRVEITVIVNTTPITSGYTIRVNGQNQPAPLNYTIIGNGMNPISIQVTHNALGQQHTKMVAFSPNGVSPQLFQFSNSSNPVISGYIKKADATPVSGVLVTFSNSGGTVSTNDSGYYSKTVTYGWSGTATPTRTGYSFTPFNISYSNVTADQSNRNYTASQQANPMVSGYVRRTDGTPMTGVMLEFSGNIGSGVFINGSGFYQKEVPSGWTGTITPIGNFGWEFVPSEISLSNVTTNLVNQNFTGLEEIPNAPDSLRAYQDGGNSAVVLNWKDKSFNETGFKIQRKTGTAGAWELLGSTGPDTNIFKDNGVQSGTEYSYRVFAYNSGGNSSFSNSVSLSLTSLHEFNGYSGEPLTYSLSQNHPNPFNPETTIRFSLREESEVSLKVYDITGIEVMSPLTNMILKSGNYGFDLDFSGNPSGIYFYRLHARSVQSNANFSEVKKLMLMK